MITIDLRNEDSILVEEKPQEKSEAKLNKKNCKELFPYQETVLQLITYHRFE